MKEILEYEKGWLVSVRELIRKFGRRKNELSMAMDNLWLKGLVKTMERPSTGQKFLMKAIPDPSLANELRNIYMTMEQYVDCIGG